MSDLGNVLLVAFGIGMLIFVHELGHFLCARWIGVRVEVFSLGFGPRLLGFRRGATDYRLSLIPLGGYVAVAGQETADRRYPARESLHSKSAGQRMLFYSGGVVMNLLFALLAFPIAFHQGVSFPAPEVGGVERGSAAWEAGLQTGDRILAVAGKPMYSFENLGVEIALAGPRPVVLTVRRGDETRTVEVLPQFEPRVGLYGLGIALPRADTPPVLLVRRGGAGAQAGLQDGDHLLQIAGLPTTGAEANRAFELLDNEHGEPLLLRVQRGADTFDVKVTPVAAGKSRPLIGVRPLARIVSGIRQGSALVQALGLQRGDILLAIDGIPFRGPDFALPATDGELVLEVLRSGKVATLRAVATAEERARLPEFVALAQDVDGMVLAPVPGGAAELAGMQPGDRLLAIGGRPVAGWDDLREQVKLAGDGPLQLEIERPGASRVAPPSRLVLLVTPEQRPSFDHGFVPQLTEKREEVRAGDFLGAVAMGLTCSLDLIKQLYVTMKRLLTGEVAAKNLGGIIQISRVSYQNTRWGMSRFLYFLALLSINLAFINILPIPVLDGGHLLFLLIERIKGSPVSTRVLSYSQVIGLVFVLALVVFVTYNDILKLL